MKIRTCFPNVCCLAVLFLAWAGAGLRAEGGDPQPGRFLMIFETSSAQKKNLVNIRQTVDKLFVSNFQNEIRTDDELAIWTVDEKVHTALVPLIDWASEEAGLNAENLNKFLAKQKYSRHASLGPIQPVLNHIIKGSDQLTVLIFCDGESRLEGTPYDDSINGNGTNGVTRGKEPQSSIIILRAAHGEYVGCTVNRYDSLNFPKFPPPKPKPQPPAKPVVVTPPPPARSAASIIVVGTKNTNPVVPVEARSVPEPVTPPVPAGTPSPAPTAAVEPAPAPAPIPTPKVSAAPPVAPAPAVVPSTSAFTPVPASGTPAAAPANPPGVVATVTVSGSGSWLPLVIGGVVLVIALNVILWLVWRARQPRGSLITSSFEQDKHPPK